MVSYVSLASLVMLMEMVCVCVSDQHRMPHERPASMYLVEQCRPEKRPVTRSSDKLTFTEGLKNLPPNSGGT